MNVLLGSAFNAIGFVVGIALYWYEARRRNLATNGMTQIMIIGAIAGVLIARVVERLAEGSNMLGVFDLFGGGRTIIGGVIGGWIAVEIAKRRMGIRTSTGPMWALALPAGEFFGRIGCWLNGCCYGKACTLPWAVEQHETMRHPTQFYMAGSALAIFVVVWFFRDRTKVFPLYILLWSSSRFIIEFFREPLAGASGISMAQKACLGLFAAGIYLYLKPDERKVSE